MKHMNGENNIRPIDFAQAKQLLDSGECVAFLDVRTPEEYIVEHAAGAALFPLDDISTESAKAAIPEKDTPVLVYCRTGRRSAMAADQLARLGYTNILDLGSLEGWPYGKDFGE